MSEDPKREREDEFERALISVLEQDFELDVRHPSDVLNRRSNNVATLRFGYQYDSPERARAVVSVEGASEFSSVLPVDFRDEDSIESSAEQCDTLAGFIHEWLESARESTLERVVAGQMPFGRREED